MAKKRKVASDPLALKLKALQEQVIALQAEAARCQQQLDLIAAKKGAAKILGSPGGDVLGLLYLGWCVAAYFLFIDTSWLAVIAAIVVVAGVMEAVVSKVVQGQATRRLAAIEPRREAAEEAFEAVLRRELLPRIHALQMATVQNIKDQTAASFLAEEVIEALLEEEVEEERMEQIDLKPGVVLFKSLLDEDLLESVDFVSVSAGASEDGVAVALLPAEAPQGEKWYLDLKVLGAVSVVALIAVGLASGSRDQVQVEASSSESLAEPAATPAAEAVAAALPAEEDLHSLDAAVAEAAPGDADAEPPAEEVVPAPAESVAQAEPASAAPAIRVQPSFDCTRASSAVEHMICGSAELAELDQKMALAYRRALTASSMAWALRDTQQAWRKNRDTCTEVQCVAFAYKNRMVELDQAAPRATPNW